MANMEIEKVAQLAHRHPPVIAYDDEHRALKRGLESLYRDGCSVEVARRFTDVFPDGSTGLYEHPGTLPETLAAIVFVASTNIVLSICIFYEDWAKADIKRLSAFCANAGIRFYPVPRLGVYAMKVFERSMLADRYDIDPPTGLLLATTVRCPFCGGPLVHHYRRHRYKDHYNGFYACIQYYKDYGEGSRCNGAIYSEDELPELVDPKIRRLRYMIRNEANEHTTIYGPEDFPEK